MTQGPDEAARGAPRRFRPPRRDTTQPISSCPNGIFSIGSPRSSPARPPACRPTQGIRPARPGMAGAGGAARPPAWLVDDRARRHRPRRSHDLEPHGRPAGRGRLVLRLADAGDMRVTRLALTPAGHAPHRGFWPIVVPPERRRDRGAAAGRGRSHVRGHTRHVPQSRRLSRFRKDDTARAARRRPNTTPGNHRIDPGRGRLAAIKSVIWTRSSSPTACTASSIPIRASSSWRWSTSSTRCGPMSGTRARCRISGDYWTVADRPPADAHGAPLRPAGARALQSLPASRRPALRRPSAAMSARASSAPTIPGSSTPTAPARRSRSPRATTARGSRRVTSSATSRPRHAWRAIAASCSPASRRGGPSLGEWLGPARIAFDDMCDRAPDGEVEVVPTCFRVIQQSNWKIFLENQLDAAAPVGDARIDRSRRRARSRRRSKEAGGKRAARLSFPVGLQHAVQQMGRLPDHRLSATAIAS